MKTPVANKVYLEAIENLRIARQQELLADPDHMELAIYKTNVAMMELNVIIRDIKNGVLI